MYLDDSYLNSLNKRNLSNEKINVTILLDYKVIMVLQVLKGTKFSDLFKALLFHFGCEYRFSYDGRYYDGEHKEVSFVIQNNDITIICLRNSNIGKYTFLGKIIFLKTIFSDERKTILSDYPESFQIGLLNSFKYLIEMIDNYSEKKVQRIKFDEKEINLEKDQSLLSLGIKEDSTLFIELKSPNS